MRPRHACRHHAAYATPSLLLIISHRIATSMKLRLLRDAAAIAATALFAADVV